MADSFIQLPTEGSGKMMDAEQLTIGNQTVYRQRAQAYFTQTLSTSFSRPNDATPYTAGDVATNSTSAPVLMTFDGAARYAGGGGIITAAQFTTSANPTTKGAFELWLFAGSAAPTADNDNAVFTPTDSELNNLVGIVAFSTGNAYVGDAATSSGGNVAYLGTYAAYAPIALPFKCSTTNDELFGAVVVRNAYTPAGGETFRATLQIKQE